MVILLTGPDLYRSHQRLRQLRQAFRDKYDPQGFTTSTLDATTMTAEELRSALLTGGLFTSRRFVAIDRYGEKSSVPAATLNSTLAPIVGDDSIIIVVRETVGAKKPSARRGKKTTTAAPEALHIPKAMKEEFAQLPEGQLVTWIQKEAQQRGGSIDKAAIVALIAAAQNDTWRIASELDKLISYAGLKPVTARLVDEMVSSPYESNIFALTDAVGSGQRAQALTMLRRELMSGMHPLALIATLASHVRTLLLVQSLSGQPPAAIAKRTGLHPYVIQKSAAQSKHFQPEQLRQWHHRLTDIDATLKSTPLEAEALLDVVFARSA